MGDDIETLFDRLRSKDDDERFPAFSRLSEITENEVDWFDARFDELVGKLHDENSYQRSIGIKLLCNLAKSDKEGKIGSILPEILACTRDEKFITERQCIQSVWKIAVAQSQHEVEIINHLKKQYITCKNEKHYNLIRQDIIQSLHAIYTHASNEDLKNEVIALIEQEENEKYRKKYVAIISDTKARRNPVPPS